MPKTPKKKFDDKWKYENSEWKGSWQTRKQVDTPADLSPEMDNMRLWASEMTEWAEYVNKQIGDLITEVENLKKNAGTAPVG